MLHEKLIHTFAVEITNYIRMYHGLYRKKSKTYSKNKAEFEFTHNSNGNTDKFDNVIKLIEKAYEDNL